MAEVYNREVIDRLEKKLLAPCCYRQFVANHGSAEAERMRKGIVQMVNQGSTDRQVIDHYKGKYGARSLGEPEGAIWWVATLVPAISVAVALLLLIRFLVSRRWNESL